MVDQRAGSIRVGTGSPACGQGGQLQVQPGAGQAGQFARRHFHRAGHGRFFGVGQGLVPHAHRARTEHRQVHRLGQVFLGHGLRQEQQAEEALFDVAVEEAAARAESFFAGEQPGMHDRLGRVARGDEIAHEFIVAVATALWRQQVFEFAGTCKHVTCAHHGDAVPGLAQTRHRCFGHTGLVHKHQPVARFGARQVLADVDLAVGWARTPARLIAPARDVVGARWSGALHFVLRHTGRDEIGLALKGVRRQRHAVAPRFAPDRLPVDCHAVGPQAPEGPKEPHVVGHRMLGVAQGVDDLRSGYAVGLAE